MSAVESELYGLQRMLYTGRCKEAFFDTESAKLEKQLESLRTQVNKQHEQSKHARERVRKFFSFARYAKEDFESDSDERKRQVLAELGEKLIFIDGKVKIQPIKYLQPVVVHKDELESRLAAVGTQSEQMKKASVEAIIQEWYTRQD